MTSKGVISFSASSKILTTLEFFPECLGEHITKDPIKCIDDPEEKEEGRKREKEKKKKKEREREREREREGKREGEREGGVLSDFGLDRRIKSSAILLSVLHKTDELPDGLVRELLEAAHNNALQ